MTEGKNRYRCPKCASGTNLYEDVYVPGWRSVDENLDVLTGPSDRDADWWQAESEGTFGCGDCEWTGRRDQLAKVGIDGNPLPFIHPQQMAIE